MRSLLALLMLSLPALAEVGPERAEKLEHILIQDCGSCHGLTMKGGLGSPLTPEALDHADAPGLAAIILDGVAGTAMPRWRPVLSEEDALWIANHLKEGGTR